MAATPLLQSQGFERTPTATKLSRGQAYVHDAFAADTGGRVRPHSGHDSTPTVPNATARSVLAGEVERTGFSIYAGNYVEVRAEDGWIWQTIHLRTIATAPRLLVFEGQGLGIAGNTGGGGALGSASKLGVHVHTSRCRDRAAADRILNGLVRARFKGETPDEWAYAMGLSDPWPIIRDGLKDSATVLPEPTKPEEADMYVYADGETNEWAVVTPSQGWLPVYPGAGDGLLKATGQKRPEVLSHEAFVAMKKTFRAA